MSSREKSAHESRHNSLRASGLLVAVLSVVVAAALQMPQFAAASIGTKTYMQALPGTRDDDVGVRGSIYTYRWPKYTGVNPTPKNVSSLYMTDPEVGGVWYIEIGVENSPWTSQNGVGGSQIDVIYAYSDMVTGTYKGPYAFTNNMAFETWYPFELENTIPRGGGEAAWQLRFNNTWKKTIRSANFYEGRGEALSERFSALDARSSFNNMQYKPLVTSGWYYWPIPVFNDYDLLQSWMHVSNQKFYTYMTP